MDSGEFPELRVRLMTWEDVPQVAEIWKDTGLAEGTHSIHTWFRFDPDGFFVIASDTEVLGVCAAVILHSRLAFVGLYAVKKSHRGKGLGLSIWKRAMEHVGQRNVGLNSVPEHLHTYRDLAGFRIVAPWCTLFCEGVPQFADKKRQLEGIQIVQIRSSVLPAVINYDASVHGYDRSKIVTLSTAEEDSLTLAAVRDGTGRVCGYGCLKKNVQGSLLVGPLYADEASIAEELLGNLVAEFPGESNGIISMAVINCNSEAMSLVNRIQLSIGTEVPRCYKKEQVHANFERVFGQHALNFSPF
ncbi:uncharacterized protein [Parasteatoda tepidariorum]|uniref:uncharacterized protein n=1 Tax=Parasteatoda tepidariorum TaxID=114398 RepID=UPI00077FA637|nr:uncharacterized protein LOC107447147 [Parasteatoda tepidariorum]